MTRGGRRRGSGRPRLPDDQRRKMWSGRLSPDTIARLRASADEWGISQAEVIDRCVATKARDKEK